MRRFLLGVSILVVTSCPVLAAQKSRTSIQSDIATVFPDNTSGMITPAKLRSALVDLSDSSLLTATDLPASGTVLFSSAGTVSGIGVGSGPSQLVRLDESGRLPALDASSIFNVPAAGLIGVVPPATLTNVPAAALTGSVPPTVLTTVPAAALTGPVPASVLTTVPAASLSGAIPATLLTSLPAANLTGSVPVATLTTLPAANLTGSVPSITLTSVPAGNLTGSVPSVTLTAVPAGNLTGSVPAGTLTTVPASNLSGSVPAATLTTVPSANLSGLVPLSLIPSYPAANLTGAIPSNLLTSVPAASLTGTIPAAVVPVARKPLFVQVASKTIGNTATPTSGFTAAPLLPANFWSAGRVIVIITDGVYSTAGLAPSLTVSLKMGSQTVASTTVSSLLNASTNRAFRSVVTITCRTTGTTGSVVESGYISIDTGLSTGSSSFPITSGITPITVDTTAAMSLDSLLAWGSANASNTLTVLDQMVEYQN